MGQRSNYAAVKDAKIMLKKEGCAGDMGQMSIDATKRDVQLCSGIFQEPLIIKKSFR